MRRTHEPSWAPDTDPYYRVGVWLVLYGLMVGAPTAALSLLLGATTVAGLTPVPGELPGVALVAGASGVAVAVGRYLLWRSQRSQRRLRRLRVDEGR